MFYWVMKRIVVGPILNLLFRPWVKGLDNVPATGPAVIVSNHLSFSDSIFLPLVMERRVTFLAKSDYFTGRGLKGWLTATFMRGVGQLPVDRSGGKASNAALNRRDVDWSSVEEWLERSWRSSAPAPPASCAGRR